MRRKNIIMAGVLALGIGCFIAPSIDLARADRSSHMLPARRFNPHPVGSFYYTAGILTFARGDVDDDGDQDIVGADFYPAGSSASKLWLNDGTGSFAEPTLLPAAINNATNVQLVDLDADLDLDLLVARTEEMPELAAFNDGKGAFNRIEAFDSGFTFQLVVADFDGDADPDMLAVNEADPDPADPHPTDARERLWLNDGTGGFTETARLTFGDWATVYAADLDGDHDHDLVVDQAPNAMVWLNDGAAHFTAGAPLPATQGVVRAVGDVDSDGDMDVLGVPEANGVLSVGTNNGAGVFSVERQPLPGLQDGLLLVGDIDHDDDLDLLRSGGINQPFMLLDNDGQGHFTLAQEFGGDTSSSTMLADVNNDTWLDVIAGHNPFISNNPTAPSIWVNAPAARPLYLPLIAR